MLGAAFEGVGGALAEAFGVQGQGLIAAVVRLIENAAMVAMDTAIGFLDLQSKVSGFGAVIAEIGTRLPGVGSQFEGAREVDPRKRLRLDVNERRARADAPADGRSARVARRIDRDQREGRDSDPQRHSG